MISLFIRSNIVYLRWSRNCRSDKISTGIKVPDGYVIDKKTRVLSGKDRYATTTNAGLIKKVADAEMIAMRDDTDEGKLSAIKMLLNQEMVAEDISISRYATILTERIKNNDILTVSGKLYSDNSKRMFATLSEHLRLMRDKGYDIPVKGSDLSGISIEQRQKVSAVTLKYFSDFKTHLIKTGSRPNTVEKYINQLKTVIGYAEKEYLITIDKSYRVQGESIPVLALMPDMITGFFSLDYDSLTDPELRAVYELSCVILITTLRMKDAISLNIEDIRTINGKAVLLGYENQKTGTRTASPIPDKLYRILQDNYSKYGRIYSVEYDKPGSFHCRVIERMPDLFRMIPECCEMHSILRTKSDGTKERITKPFFEYIKPHTLRKTAITNMLHSGVSTRNIKAMSGHTGNSAAFERYVGFVEQTFNKEVEDYQSKLLG